jgi:hypothetical protein
MFSELFAEFGVLDILVVLNYFQGIKQNKHLKKSNKLALTIALMQEQDQHEILKTLKEIRDERKN